MREIEQQRGVIQEPRNLGFVSGIVVPANLCDLGDQDESVRRARMERFGIRVERVLKAVCHSVQPDRFRIFAFHRGGEPFRVFDGPYERFGLCRVIAEEVTRRRSCSAGEFPLDLGRQPKSLAAEFGVLPSVSLRVIEGHAHGRLFRAGRCSCGHERRMRRREVRIRQDIILRM